jgi:hypothetical protein
MMPPIWENRMAKMIEVKLHRLTCEFAGPNDDGELKLSGNLRVLAFVDPNNITFNETIFEFPNAPIRMRKGNSIDINRDVRVLMATGGEDPPFATHFVRFGGQVIETGQLNPWEEFETVHTDDVVNTEPLIWRIYFGKHHEIVRADFSTVFVHPI